MSETTVHRFALPPQERWFAAFVLLTHGTVHLMGFMWAFDLASPEGIGGPTLLPSNIVPGDPLAVALGVFWLAAAVAFVAAATTALVATNWLRVLAGAAAGISLIPTILWWSDAWIGAVLSSVILSVALLWPRLVRKRRGRDHSPHTEFGPRTKDSVHGNI